MSVVLNVGLGIIVVILSIGLKDEYDKRARLEQRLSGDKKTFYSTFLEMLSDVLREKKEKKQQFKTTKQLEEFMDRFKFMMLLNASDQAYRYFADQTQKSFKGERLSPEEMGKLFLVFRKDTLGKLI